MKRIIIPQSMIPALRDGRKTQHRVPVPHQEAVRTMKYAGQLKDGTWMWTDHMPPKKWDSWFDAEYLKGGGVKCPYKVGEELWVAETWEPRVVHQCFNGDCNCGDVMVGYPSDDSSVFFDKALVPAEWPPKIIFGRKGPCSPVTMPRWASRFVLTVIDVGVERVRDIKADAVEAEGVPFADMLPPFPPRAANLDAIANMVARTAYSKFYDATHGPGAWTRNDWVWVLTFTSKETTR